MAGAGAGTGAVPKQDGSETLSVTVENKIGEILLIEKFG